MTHAFDKDYWDKHWQSGADGGPGAMGDNPPNPYLEREVGGLTPGTALDAGCGAGAEAIWLAAAGWQVTGADISRDALARAAERAATSGVADGVEWVEADLGSWAPGRQFDLVTTHYAHPAMPQLEFYDRVAGWVARGGTLLVVGHRHDAAPGGHGHGHGHGHGDDHGAGAGNEPPAEASVTAAAVTAGLDPTVWDVVTAAEPDRTMDAPDGRKVPLRDVVVRAVRRS